MKVDASFDKELIGVMDKVISITMKDTTKDNCIRYIIMNGQITMFLDEDTADKIVFHLGSVLQEISQYKESKKLLDKKK